MILIRLDFKEREAPLYLSGIGLSALRTVGFALGSTQINPCGTQHLFLPGLKNSALQGQRLSRQNK